MNDDTKARRLARFNQAFCHGVPHNKALGMELLDYAENAIWMRIPYAPHLVGNPITGVLHGGVVTSFMDAACGAAVFISLGKPQRIATLDLRIDYLKPARPELALITHAACTRRTRRVAFVRAETYHEAEGPQHPIATATGTFMIFSDQRSTLAKHGAS